ncbi:hypothetical protein AB0C02_21695 [Micromonospora sp. NPDC048999]
MPAPRRGADTTDRSPSRRAGTLRRPRVRVPQPRIVPAELEVR